MIILIKVIHQSQEIILNIDTKALENIKIAKDLYNKALEAQKNGQWAEYGTFIKQLGDILDKIGK